MDFEEVYTREFPGVYKYLLALCGSPGMAEELAQEEELIFLCGQYEGISRKTVKTQLGEVDIKVPRDRNGTFEPKLIGKYSRNAEGMEEKIMDLYACGMSQRDTAEQIKKLYDVDILPELVTKITEKIM